MSKLTVESIIRIYGSKVKEVKVFNEKKRTQAENFLQIEPVAFALADEPDVLRIYVDKESAEASLDGTLQDSEQGTEEAQEAKKEEAENGRKKAIKRTQKLVYYFADFMLQEEEAGNREKAEIEKMMKEAEDSDKVVCAVSCAENNIRCMHDCMKAANDVVKFLADKENEVEEWQIAAINAMYDTCNTMEEGHAVIPFDLPYAIKGLLLQWDDEQSSAGLMLEAIK